LSQILYANFLPTNYVMHPWSYIM